jgi:putative addiction module component (TIGR02574 family)
VRYSTRVTIETVMEQALRLSAEDRAEVVARLLDSLDEDASVDPGHEAAWTEVIDRRLKDIREGRVELVDSSVVMARVQQAGAATAAARNKR